MNLKRIVGEGFVAGLIGAAAVAAWFLLVDIVSGQAFYTPAMLGSALFQGLRDPTEVEVTFQAVILYTMLHILAFVMVGMISAMLASIVESFPSTLFVVVVLFAIFEVGFYVIVLVFAQPLLGALTWSNVMIGNFIAAGGMGYFLWRVHPRIREALAAHPLGETADGE